MAIRAQTEELQIVAAGKPDIQKLITMGVVKPEEVDPETGLRRQPKHKYRIITKRRKNPETGTYEMMKLKENFGHVEDPDFPGWRIGLSPEKYWKMLEQQHYDRTYRGRRGRSAPELTEEEAQLFSDWLDKHLDLVEDKDPEDVPVDPIVRKKRKKIEKSKDDSKKVTNKANG